MIERQGRIIAIHANHMELAVQPEAACSACGARQACQGEKNRTVLSLPLQPGLAAGDQVALSMEAGTLTRSALLAYLLPAITLILGAQLGDWIGRSNVFAMSGAALGLAAGLLAARLLAGFFSHVELQPNVHACFQTPTLRSPAP
ncbi:SoxR reducing system RseC family protein [Uliginosibacterium sp. 31-16]|uniref:SoxR reducing system RseC family protein n=1 Tax=Uliginosibacterium sp. 31-16 TaxID=3068315 RepID=UPI00274028A5|nr:SoxR reducing system RseC family protein [Uliginosibacterium sp. 31-16]MDP5237975.1 SoxR reducing system RseC family protein [Uliginosibacterium sp. 31-16]